MARESVKVILGGTRLGNRAEFMPGAGLDDLLDALRSHGMTTIDTAQSYGESEAALGQVRAGDMFTIDTKWSPPTWEQPAPAWATRDKIVSSAKQSIQRLGIQQVDVFYLHRPDTLVPISETLAAVNEVYELGLFRRFGLSGFPVKEVERVHDYCDEHGYPLPKVYQGSYNPLERSKETNLFPTLRRLGMSFYAYSPSAGGFLGKTVAQAKEMAQDLSKATVTCRQYIRDPESAEALALWNGIATREGVSPAELAYRWMAYHSALQSQYGDTLVIGTGSLKQFEDTLAGLDKGPLSNEAHESVINIARGKGNEK